MIKTLFQYFSQPTGDTNNWAVKPVDKIRDGMFKGYYYLSVINSCTVDANGCEGGLIITTHGNCAISFINITGEVIIHNWGIDDAVVFNDYGSDGKRAIAIRNYTTAIVKRNPLSNNPEFDIDLIVPDYSKSIFGDKLIEPGIYSWMCADIPLPSGVDLGWSCVMDHHHYVPIISKMLLNDNFTHDDLVIEQYDVWRYIYPKWLLGKYTDTPYTQDISGICTITGTLLHSNKLTTMNVDTSANKK